MEEISERIVHLDICRVNTPGVGLLRLFDAQLYTDVSFVLGKQKVHAHRIVLASQSEYFECLLYGPMKEGRSSEITLEETPVEAFRELLKFAYSGRISTMNFTTALDLHILADRFGFPCLKDAIESYLQSIISVDNVLHLAAHAQASSAVHLQEQCEQCMDQNARVVIRSQDVQLLPKENFKALIARDTFVVEEVEIFSAVQQWIEGNKMNRDEVVDLLECVRLTEIPHSELESLVLPSGLYERCQVLEAMGVRGTAFDKDLIATRGKTAENLNLFMERGTKLLTCTNYLLDILPEKEDTWSCVSDFLFNLTGSAADDPAYITVKFDDMYIVNQITFTGYSDQTYSSDVGREHSPFCYQIWVSKDGRQWVTVLDYSRLKCYSVQRLFFTKMAIRYVRILQTRGKEKFTVHLDSCSYVGPVPYKFRDLGLIAPFLPTTPNFTQYVRFSDVCRGARAFLTFTQPYSISTVRFRLQGLEGHGDVAVSVATQNRTKCYQPIAHLKNINLSSNLIEAVFAERAVSIVSITITHIQLHNEVGPPRPEKPIPQFRVTELVCQMVEE